MLYGFDTKDDKAATAALITYAVYKSRDVKRGPSGYEMWAQIERFARTSSKRATDFGTFLNKFKSKMACGTINPKWTSTGILKKTATILETGEIITQTKDTKDRDFMIEIMESPQEYQKQVIDMIYKQTQRIVLLVRDRLEREKIVIDYLEEEEV